MQDKEDTTKIHGIKTKVGTRTPDPASPTAINDLKIDQSRLVEAVRDKIMQASG